eukprot:TRINITY_DN36844_c0_g1_i4.p1 TRINITY_DN36844_c0_g1~~TRINITY_DN36844_c0_g1_i4.p1  ORF type:complete len:1679 (-),score=376.22 TRINITY_DN36844_c0_g1_i4:146-5182(-)
MLQPLQQTTMFEDGVQSGEEFGAEAITSPAVPASPASHTLLRGRARMSKEFVSEMLSVVSSTVTKADRTYSSWPARLVDSWQVQALGLLLSATHLVSGCVMLAGFWSTGHFEDDWTVPVIVIVTGIALGLFTILELLIRLRDQGGPFLQLASWLKFLCIMYHKAEACMLGLCVAAAIGNTLILSVIFFNTDSYSETWFHEQALANFCVIFHRVMRIWGLFYGISVQETLRCREKRAKAAKEKMWWDEDRLRRKKYTSRPSYHLQKLVDRWSVQLLLMFYLMVYIFIPPETGRLVYGAGGCALMGLLTCEFLARCIAQEGEPFFTPLLHKVDVAFLVTGLTFLADSLWNATKRFHSLMFLVILTQRFLRFLEIRFKVSGSAHDSTTVFDAHIAMTLAAKLGDLLEVPPSNVEVKIQENIVVKIEKAKIKPEPFRQLHLPITVTGGIIQDFNVSIRFRAPKSGDEDANTHIEVKNLLLLVGPGDGLAEAGGLGTAGEYWNHENVIDAKSKLVDLICKHLQPRHRSEQAEEEQAAASPSMKSVKSGTSSGSSPSTKKSGKSAATGTSNSATPSAYQGARRFRNIVNEAKQRYAAMVKERALESVRVSIRNVLLQYEDPHNKLGRGHMTVGFKVGTIDVDRAEKRHVKCSMARIGLFVETQERTRGPRHPTATSSSHAAATVVSVESPKRVSTASSVTAGEDGRDSRLKSPTRQAPHHQKRAESQHIMAARHSDTWNSEKTNDTRSADTSQVIWKTRFAQKLERNPKEALKELIRLNTAERVRLWAFEEMEKKDGKVVTVRQRHLRSERWPEHRLVFSLLSFQFEGSPDSPPDAGEGDEDRFRRSCGSSSSTLGMASASVSVTKRASVSDGTKDETAPPSSQNWKYRLKTRPVYITVDDEQVRCLRTVLNCLKTWVAHDNAMKWRPSMQLSDDCLKRPCDDFDTTRCRSSLARLWWIYAVNRVLAPMRKRLRTPWRDVVWQSWQFRSYNDLLTEIASRPNAHIGPGAVWDVTEYERNTLHEIQVRLPLPQIVDCQKRALAWAVELKHKAKNPSQKKLELGRHVAGEVLDFDASESDDSSEDDAKAKEVVGNLKASLNATAARETMARVSSTMSWQLAGLQGMRKSKDGDTDKKPAADEEGSAGVGGGGSSTFTFGAPQPKSQARGKRNTLTGEASTSAVEGKQQENKPPATDLVAGDWTVHVCRIEVRVLRWQSPHNEPRHVLFDLGVTEVRGEACIMSSDALAIASEEGSDGRSSPRNPASRVFRSGIDTHQLHQINLDAWMPVCNGVLTVEHFSMSSPDGEKLKLAEGQRICSITKFVTIPPPQSPLLAGARVGEAVALAVRIGMTPSEKTFGEVFLPDMRIMVYDGLVKALLPYLKDSASSTMKAKTQQDSLMSSLGPLPSVTAGLREHEANVHLARVLLQKAVAKIKQFELLVGLQGDPSELLVHVSAGALHCIQVVGVTESSVLIEDCRMWPCRMDIDRTGEPKDKGTFFRSTTDELREQMTDRGKSVKEIRSQIMRQQRIAVQDVSYVNDALNKLLPWNDDAWRKRGWLWETEKEGGQCNATAPKDSVYTPLAAALHFGSTGKGKAMAAGTPSAAAGGLGRQAASEQTTTKPHMDVSLRVLPRWPRASVLAKPEGEPGSPRNGKQWLTSTLNKESAQWHAQVEEYRKQTAGKLMSL